MAQIYEARVRRYHDRIVISVEPVTREAWRLVHQALRVARESIRDNGIDNATGFTPPREVDSAAVMTALACTENFIERAARATEEFLRAEGATVIPPPPRPNAS